MSAEEKKEAEEQQDFELSTQASTAEPVPKKGKDLKTVHTCWCLNMFTFVLLTRHSGLTTDSIESLKVEKEPPPKPPHTYYNVHHYPDGGEGRGSGLIKLSVPIL